jgi:hypothetical protein
MGLERQDYLQAPGEYDCAPWTPPQACCVRKGTAPGATTTFGTAAPICRP